MAANIPRFCVQDVGDLPKQEDAFCRGGTQFTTVAWITDLSEERLRHSLSPVRIPSHGRGQVAQVVSDGSRGSTIKLFHRGHAVMATGTTELRSDRHPTICQV